MTASGQSVTPLAGRPLRPTIVAPAVVFVLAFAVHARTIGYSFVGWEDDQNVVRNDAVTTPERVPLGRHLLTPYLGYPAPVVIGSYALENAVFGMTPEAFHVTNVLVHACTAAVVVLVLFALGCGPIVASGAGLLFAVHPACVEPVSWVSGRKELLSALFTALALRSFLAARAAGDGLRRRLPAFAFLLLGALSSASALLLPAVFLVLDRGARRGRAVWIAGVAVGIVLATLALEQERDIRAAGELAPVAVGMIARVLSAVARHALLVVQPFASGATYMEDPGPAGAFVLGIGALVAGSIAALTFVEVRKGRAAALGLLAGGFAYLPLSGIVPLERPVADSNVYVPLLGACLAVAPAVEVLARRATALHRRLATAAAAGVVTLLAGISLARAPQWEDGVSLWTEARREHPDSPAVCRKLGSAHLYLERFEPARAAAVYRDCIDTLGNRPFFVKHLAIATFLAGDLDQADVLFQEFQRENPGDRSADRYIEAIERARR